MATQLSAVPPAVSSAGITAIEPNSSDIAATGALQMASHTIVDGANYNNLQTIVPDINFNINEEDFDDDDFDEEFSDEFCDEDDMMDAQTNVTESNDMTKQLLDFAQHVNTDIQKYFGRKKDEDSCDIYQDKWTSKRSGRELYLADILRIANGGDSADDVRKKSRKETESKKNETHRTSGKVNKSVGLGPLDELFKDVHNDVKETVKKDKKPKRLQGSYGKGTSLLDRKLPSSFWIEPDIQQGTNDVHKTKGPNYPTEADSSQVKALQAPSTPDFSDLLESWTGEEPSSTVTATQTTITTTFSSQNSSVVMER